MGVRLFVVLRLTLSNYPYAVEVLAFQVCMEIFQLRELQVHVGRKRKRLAEL
jgi:hypothetical protein